VLVLHNNDGFFREYVVLIDKDMVDSPEPYRLSPTNWVNRLSFAGLVIPMLVLGVTLFSPA
jgi:hypothetical protein